MKLIALCGRPTSGKDEVAKILNELYKVEKVDDGWALRDFCMRHLGMSHWETHTQDGKRCYTKILERDWQNRDVLGSLGKKLEEMFGEHIMPWTAVQGLDPSKDYCFPSCRKTQGWFYKQQGGIVVEVVRPGTVESPYDFDRYDPAAVDIVINNDGGTFGWRRHLVREVINKLGDYVNSKGFDVVA